MADFNSFLEDATVKSHKEFRKFKYKQIKEVLTNGKVQVINPNLSDESDIIVWNESKIEPITTFFSFCTLNTMGAFSYTHSRPFNGLSVGRYCSLAGDIRLFGASHYTDWVSTSSWFYDPKFIESERPLSFDDRMKNRTRIGNDVWIGSHVALARGITIGNGAVIATGSIVTKDVPEYAIVGGVPAGIIKFRFNDDIVNELKSLKWWDYHVNDFKGLDITSPEHFIDGLRNMIDKNIIKKYSPSYVDFSSI